METVNVNLKTCTWRCADYWDAPGPYSLKHGEHWSMCAAATKVLIPLPLEPFRSVVFEVRLGECDRIIGALTSCGTGKHHRDCPARPIRVACSIGGKTWEESEVVDSHLDDGRDTTVREEDACRERWGLVKALVLGYSAWDYTMSNAKAVPLATITAMLARRDAVFAALVEMARAEKSAVRAQQRCDDAFPYSRFAAPDDDDRRKDRPSVGRLAAFVAHIIQEIRHV